MLSDLLFRLRSLFRRRAVERELDEELRFHIEQQVEKLMAAGLTREQAVRESRLMFGGLGHVKEDCRESRGVTLLETTAQDLRFALRQLAKTPAFSITILLTLALGIGANAAIFTLVNAVLERNLPVVEPQTLVRLGENNDCCVGSGARKDGSFSYFSTDSYERFRKNMSEFEELAAMQAGFGYRPITARRDGTQEISRSVMGEFVSGNYFRTFGLRPAAGRLFIDADDMTGATPTAVMSYENWQHHYAGDASIVGSTFRVNTKPVTIVGIAPRGFFGDRLTSTPPDFYLPIETMPMLANAPYVHNPGSQWLYIVGRVKPGVALSPIEQKVSAILRQTFQSRGKFTSEKDKLYLPTIHVKLTSGGAGIQTMQDEYGSHLHLLMWVAGLVLLIACANIANLLLVRGMARRGEMSVRTALGAVRARIVRQLLTESVLLSGLGGLAGLAVAYGGTRMLLMLAFPGAQNVPINPVPSLPVLGFACGLSLVTGILFGVAPAWIAAQAKPADALRGNTRTTASGTPLLQRSLVVVQVALSLILLVGAGLFLESLMKLEGTDMKLDPTNRYIVHINPQAAGYMQTQLDVLYHTMESRFHALPGVTKVGITSYTPMEDNNNGWGIEIQGRPESYTIASVLRVNADYFDSVGTRVRRGRGIAATDIPGTTPVTVVNQTFVNKMFKPGENPIGQHLGFPGPDTDGAWEIVGVVEDTTYESVRMKDHPMFFIPTMQRPLSDKSPIETDDALYAGAIVIETSRPVDGMEAMARTTLAGINPNLTVVKFQTFKDQIADQFTEERMISRLTMLFGGLALLLATIGLYGVTAYGVARRGPEIGIRMALGAERRGVIAMVMRGAMIQSAIGLAIGVPVAMMSVRFIKAELYEMTQADFRVMLGAIVTLGLAACFAGLVPSWKAASINPVEALRIEEA